MKYNSDSIELIESINNRLDAILKLSEWVDSLLQDSYEDAKPCASLIHYFDGYFTERYLAHCCYVLTDKLPIPDFRELRSAGLGKFMDASHAGVTYRNCYFILAEQEDNLFLHLHELVHVCQWDILGQERFIKRYMYELLRYGYEDSPLEQMARTFEYYYSIQKEPIDVMEALRGELAD